MEKMKVVLEKARTELVYRKKGSEFIVIRTVPGKDFYFAKSHGEDEYSLEYSLLLVNGTILEAKEITKKDYENY